MMLARAIIVILLLVAVSSAFKTTDYANSTVLKEERYNLYWTVDRTAGVIHIALKAKTTGWVGFGLGEPISGSMPGSDMAIVYVKDGKATIEDRYAVGFVTPIMDDCQDWKLVGGEEVDGWTIVEFTRNIEASDTIQDRTIVAGENMIVWAYGTSDTFGYHSNNREYTTVVFWPDTDRFVEPTDGIKSMELVMSGYEIPPNMTVYANQVFVLPYETEGPAHIIQIDPLINPDTLDYVHHFFVYSCLNTTGSAVNYLINNPMNDKVVGTVGCNQQVFAWGLGGNSLYLPPQAGFLMNNSDNALRYLLVQIHYTNPNKLSGLKDYSGIKITWTKTLRPNHAGFLLLGDPYLRGTPIPPGQASYQVEYTCPSECTSLWSHPITVFGDFLHMHEIGNMAWSRRWTKENVSLGYTNRAEYFAYDKQQITPVDFVINPGDRINTHCVWDSRDRTAPTLIGKNTEDEMCAESLFYYPALLTTLGTPFQLCGLSYLKNNQTFCGANNIFTPGSNPVFTDPPADKNKVWGQPNPDATCSIDSNSDSNSNANSNSKSSSDDKEDSASSRVLVFVPLVLATVVAMLL